jgi:hypothetical protein
MANTSSYRKTAPDLESLLAACRENEAILPDILIERTSLESNLTRARTLWERQVSYTAARQEATQQLQQVLAESRQIAERIRDAVKFKIGRRNERLVQFNVAPLRKVPRKTAAEKEPAPSV